MSKSNSRLAKAKCTRLMNALKDLEDAYLALCRTDGEQTMDIVERHEAFTTDEELDACECNLCGYYKAARRLIGLDERQLYHPLVEAILSTPRSWSFLREFHAPLATGMKRDLNKTRWIAGKGDSKSENCIQALNALLQGRKVFKNAKRRKTARLTSYEAIRRSFVGRGLIDPMKPVGRTAFPRRAKLFMAIGSGGNGPRFNIRARPELNLNELEPEIKEIWDRLRRMVHESRWDEKTLSELRQEDKDLAKLKPYPPMTERLRALKSR